MLALFPSMKYKAWYALGELVDNAIQSYLSNEQALHAAFPDYRLRVDIEIEQDRITVRDNAAGIRGQDVARAFAPASPPPDRTGLSQFGIGMKSAACWYAKHFSVTTAALDESLVRSVEIDIARILETRSDRVDIHTAAARPDSHGTTVTLEQLNQPTPTGRTLGKIRSYLSSIYRSFLSNGSVELTVGGKALTYTEPAVLTAPAWNDPAGPALLWRKNVDVLLATSNRRITGWVGIRETGSTQEAGLALLHRGKVVVGAGSMAQDNDGSYRPEQIFGRTNSFAYQRLFGELDVSALGVAYSKDDLIWDAEDEADFLDALRAELDAEPLPLIRMANGYRKTDHHRDADIEREVQRAVDASATAAAAAFVEAPTTELPQSTSPRPRPRPSAPGRHGAGPALTAPVSADFELPAEFGTTMRLAVVNEQFDSRLLRIGRDGLNDVITINRGSPFMAAFASLPSGEIEPILRLCLAIALAEIEARKTGVPQASAVRNKLNDLLDGPLATRAGDPS